MSGRLFLCKAIALPNQATRRFLHIIDTMDYKTSAPMTSSGLALSVSLAFAVVRIRSLLLLLVLLESLLLPLLLG
eukprot:s3095_g3.t1